MPRITKKTGLTSAKAEADSLKDSSKDVSKLVEPDESPDLSLPRLKLSLRLMHGDEIALGPGKAELLEAISRTGSISAAGKSMGMSYRRAWMLVDVMNRCFKSPLVETAKGGSHGGGARLTPLGEDVLARYRAMDAASKQVAAAYLGLFKNLMGDESAVNDGEEAKSSSA